MSASKETKDSALNLGISANDKNTINIFGQAMEEDYIAFDKLDRNHLQGRPNTKHGDAAEVLGVKDRNKQNIIDGKNEKMQLSSSKTDPITDTFTIDSTGKVIDRAQVKYYSDATKTADALSDPKYNKNPTKYAPPEQVEEIKRIASEKARKLRKLAKLDIDAGNTVEAEAKIIQAKAYENTSKNVKGLTRTLEEAKAAVKNDASRYFVTAKDIAKTANSAGLKQAKSGALIAGTISGAQNIIAFAKGEKEINEMLICTSIDTAKGAVTSYAVTFTGSALKAGIEQTGKKVISQGAKNVCEVLSKGNTPALIVTSTLEVGKSLYRYMDGQINEEELLLELGEKGTGIVASAYCADIGGIIGGVIGTAFLPGIGTVAGELVGGVVGGMVGYICGTQLYQATINLISMPGLSSEKYRKLENLSVQAKKYMERERAELEKSIEQNFADRDLQLSGYFSLMDNAIISNDINEISEQLTNISTFFGKSLKFSSFKEFDKFMNDSTSVLSF